MKNTLQNTMTPSEKDAVVALHLAAFGPDEGEEVATLARNLLALSDVLSVNHWQDGQIVGNAIFSTFTFVAHSDVRCALLSPCGVLPDYQGRGIGGAVMKAAQAELSECGMDAAFVLGVPGFYPRFGYHPTALETPYPDLLTIPASWMALELTPGTLARIGGQTRAAEPLMNPAFWDTSPYDADFDGS